MRFAAMVLVLLTGCGPVPVAPALPSTPTIVRAAPTNTVVVQTPTRAAPTPTPRPALRFPLDIPASDASPAYTITAQPPRRDAEGRHRYEVDLTVPESYGRDEMIAVLRHAALWSLDVFPDANTLLVWAFTLPRNSSAGWTGQAIVSRDGRGWSTSDIDDGKIHITYSSLLEPTTKVDLPR